MCSMSRFMFFPPRVFSETIPYCFSHERYKDSKEMQIRRARIIGNTSLQSGVHICDDWRAINHT